MPPLAIKSLRSVFRKRKQVTDKPAVIKELRASIDRLGFTPTEIWGEQIEDRGSQITFSALG